MTPTPADAPRVVTATLLRDWALPGSGGTKRSRGTVAVAGGSRSTPGAVMLAGLAALRVGAGVLALAVAEPVAASVAAAVPEASVTALALVGDRTDAAVEGVVGLGRHRPGRARPRRPRAGRTAAA